MDPQSNAALSVTCFTDQIINYGIFGSAKSILLVSSAQVNHDETFWDKAGARQIRRISFPRHYLTDSRLDYRNIGNSSGDSFVFPFTAAELGAALIRNGRRERAHLAYLRRSTGSELWARHIASLDRETRSPMGAEVGTADPRAGPSGSFEHL
jgi:hypothetical protein